MTYFRNLENKTKQREKKDKEKMKVSGKSVFKVRDLIKQKNKNYLEDEETYEQKNNRIYKGIKRQKDRGLDGCID